MDGRARTRGALTPQRWRLGDFWADHNQKRHGYKLLPDYVYVEVKTIIQEHGLEFQHEGRTGSSAECTMRDADHTRVAALLPTCELLLQHFCTM